VVWDRLWAHLREAGAGGVTTIALAGVDLALWDLHCGERSLADVLGRRRAAVPVYGSGVNRHYTLEELVAQARRWKAAGYPAVKIKVGLPDLREDVERVAAVREVIGPDVALMVDANQRWDLLRARRAIEALAPYGLHWVEEPLPADDVAAHVELRRSVDVPIAVGENVHTGYGFRDLLAAGACDVVQPNVVRVGGITPFLRIAELAAPTTSRSTRTCCPRSPASSPAPSPSPAWSRRWRTRRSPRSGCSPSRTRWRSPAASCAPTGGRAWACAGPDPAGRMRDGAPGRFTVRSGRDRHTTMRSRGRLLTRSPPVSVQTTMSSMRAPCRPGR